MKNVAILLLGLFISQNSFAQSTPNAFRIGVKAETNLGWFKATSQRSLEASGAGIGIGYGAMFDYFFKPNYAFSFELQMTSIKGSVQLLNPQIFDKDPNGDTISMLQYKYRNQFIELPVTLKLRTREIGYLSYWTQFGVAPGFLFDARASISGSLPTAIDQLDPSNYRTNDNEGDDFTVDGFDDEVFIIRLPVIVGAGVNYQLPGNAVAHAGIRFSNSFSDVFVKDKGVSATQNYISLTAGLFF